MNAQERAAWLNYPGIRFTIDEAIDAVRAEAGMWHALPVGSILYALTTADEESKALKEDVQTVLSDYADAAKRMFDAEDTIKTLRDALKAEIDKRAEFSRSALWNSLMGRNFSDDDARRIVTANYGPPVLGW